MDAQYFSQLPNDVQEWAQNIEAHCGFDISVRREPRRHTACEFGPGYARILLPNNGVLRPESGFHELSHLDRFLVKGIGQLVPVGSALHAPEAAFTKLDNALEHIAFVGAEVARFPGRNDYWCEIIRRELQRLPGAAMDKNDRKMWTLVLNAFFAIANLQAVATVEELQQAIHRYLNVGEVEDFVATVRDRLEDKLTLSQFICGKWGFQLHTVGLNCIDVASGSEFVTPLG